METKLIKPSANPHNYISLLLLSGLIILRFPLIILVFYKVLPINQSTMMNIFQNGTYLFTAMLIWLNRGELRRFHLGTGAVFIFVFAPILSFISHKILIPYTPFPKLVMDMPWFQFGVALILLIMLIYSHAIPYKIDVRHTLKWLAISIIIGILAGAMYGYFILAPDPKSPFKASISYALYRFFNQLNNAAVLEEPLFRGFIWGYLVRLGWKDKWVWLLQGFLFMMAHVYYLGSLNSAFFIGVPVTALVLGLLAWKSRSIGTSMTAHALTNTFGDLVAHFRW